jgi:hypothetical protein
MHGEEPARTPEIVLQLNNLGEQVEQVFKLTQLLEERLTPVVMPSRPPAETTGHAVDKAASPETPLGNQLSNIRTTAAATINRLQDIMQRLEV